MCWLSSSTDILSLFKYDYICNSSMVFPSLCRLFGHSGACSACGQSIPASEMVMRAQGNVYHLKVTHSPVSKHSRIVSIKKSINELSVHRFLFFFLAQHFIWQNISQWNDRLFSGNSFHGRLIQIFCPLKPRSFLTMTASSHLLMNRTKSQINNFYFCQTDVRQKKIYVATCVAL